MHLEYINSVSATYHYWLALHVFTAEKPPQTEPKNPCQPSPCGPNAACRVSDDGPSCSCLPDFIGSPPSCRPQCVSNSECASHLACINLKCHDPCPGSCGTNAQCHVVSHTPNCVCPNGFTGDPFIQCLVQQCKNVILTVMHNSDFETVCVCVCVCNYDFVVRCKSCISTLISSL